MNFQDFREEQMRFIIRSTKLELCRHCRNRKFDKRVELTLNLQNYPILPFLFDKIAIFALKSDSYWKKWQRIR